MTPNNTLLHFDAFRVSLDLIRSLRPVISDLQKHDASLTTQLRKASSSVALNIAEGRRRAGRDRTHLWRVAAGSAEEVRACLYVAEAAGHASQKAISQSLELLDRILAMLWKLTH